jgi:hypothetical protein
MMHTVETVEREWLERFCQEFHSIRLNTVGMRLVSHSNHTQAVTALTQIQLEEINMFTLKISQCKNKFKQCSTQTMSGLFIASSLLEFTVSSSLSNRKGANPKESISVLVLGQQMNSNSVEDN